MTTGKKTRTKAAERNGALSGRTRSRKQLNASDIPPTLQQAWETGAGTAVPLLRLSSQAGSRDKRSFKSGVRAKVQGSEKKKSSTVFRFIAARRNNGRKGTAQSAKAAESRQDTETYLISSFGSVQLAEIFHDIQRAL